MKTTRSAAGKPPGILVAMAGVLPEMEAEFNRWYEEEAVPDRLALPGVEAVTRYQAVGGNCSYLVVYRCESIDTLVSDAYRRHMAAPSEWRLRVRKGFRNLQFAALRETWSAGSGIGGHALVVQCAPAKGREAEVRDYIANEFAPRIRVQGGIVRMALWEGDPQVTASVDVSSRENLENYTSWILVMESSDLIQHAPALQAALLSREVAQAGLLVGAIMRYDLLACYTRNS
jgi:hypothetical protein